MTTGAYLDFERPIIELEEKIAEMESMAKERGIDVSAELSTLQAKLTRLKEDIFTSLSPIQQVQLARHPRRPYPLDFIERCFTDWFELHGDRAYADDHAMISGLARFDGQPVMVIGQQKGRGTKENLRRNFGMPHPEGYRKALRLMHLAEKFGHPIITLIDTPGAYPGIGAEERGQAEAIARNLREMAALQVPTISVVTGEGASGGALGIGITDRILILENAFYSVISPEGCAAILWKDGEKRDLAARAMKITARDLYELGVVDEIVVEPMGGVPANGRVAERGRDSRRSPQRLAGADSLLNELSHLDAEGRARMVDVSEKAVTRRIARASGSLMMSSQALDQLASGRLPKGDALAVARVAGIQAAKETARLVPLCHPLPLDHVAVEAELDPHLPGVRVTSEVIVTARTGAEMEALVAVSGALLAIYDMAKSVDRSMTLGAIRLEQKTGGASGTYVREKSE
jgi:acetyl-CoA carboxylase carboxyl transferase subunit alpha